MAMDLLVEAELRRAAGHSGCVLCRLDQEAAVRYLRTVLGEGTTDGATRARLGCSWGFYGRHAWEFLGLEWDQTNGNLGAATVLEGLVEAVEATIAGHLNEARRLAGREGRCRAVVERLVRAIEPADLCRACRAQADHEAYAAIILVRTLDRCAGAAGSRCPVAPARRPVSAKRSVQRCGSS